MAGLRVCSSHRRASNLQWMRSVKLPNCSRKTSCMCALPWSSSSGTHDTVGNVVACRKCRLLEPPLATLRSVACWALSDPPLVALWVLRQQAYQECVLFCNRLSVSPARGAACASTKHTTFVCKGRVDRWMHGLMQPCTPRSIYQQNSNICQGFFLPAALGSIFFL